MVHNRFSYLVLTDGGTNGKPPTSSWNVESRMTKSIIWSASSNAGDKGTQTTMKASWNGVGTSNGGACIGHLYLL